MRMMQDAIADGLLTVQYPDRLDHRHTGGLLLSAGARLSRRPVMPKRTRPVGHTQAFAPSISAIRGGLGRRHRCAQIAPRPEKYFYPTVLNASIRWPTYGTAVEILTVWVIAHPLATASARAER